MESKHNKKGRRNQNSCAKGSGVQTVPMTPRLLAILDYVAQYISDNRCSPTYQEIGAACGMNSVASVHGHIRRLIQGGMLTKESLMRGLALTDKARQIARVGSAA